jgi:hypothetical protein
MNDSVNLERRYRRLLACYPRAFRHEHEREMLAVLMAGAGAEQQRPTPAESADLVRNAIWIRLRPGTPRSTRTVWWAVMLMFVSAVLELSALLAVVLTRAGLESAVAAQNPEFSAAHARSLVHAQVIVPIEIGAPIAAALWLVLAWGNGRGGRWARLGAAGLSGLNALSLLSSLAQGAVAYAPLDVIAGASLCLVSLAAAVLTFHPRSGPYYRARPIAE